MMKIAIVGGGLLGKLFAWRLCQHHEVHLYSHPHASENTCSLIAGAMMSPYAESFVLNPYWLSMAKRSLKLWPTILRSLPEAVYFQNHGSIVVALHEHQDLFEKWVLGVKRHAPDVKPLMGRDDVLRCLLPDEAHLNPRQLLCVLSDFLHKQKIHWYEEVVDELPSQFDWVIDCRGLGAKKNVNGLRGTRGEMLLVHAQNVHLSQALRFLHPLYGCYIVPQGNNQYMIGATHQESESLDPIYVKSIMLLLTGAMLVEPRFKDATLLETKVGLRPTNDSHLPFVQIKARQITVNGLFRHGFLLAPALVESLVNIIMEGENNEPNYDHLQSTNTMGDKQLLFTAFA